MTLMSREERALLAAVCDAPEDDLPRLAYADWLDDHGDEVRAGFIRAQVELARLPSWDRKAEALRKKTEKLSRGNLAAWYVPLMEATKGEVSGEFHRGFVGSLIGAAGDITRHLAVAVRRFPIRELQIDCSGGQPSAREAIALAAHRDLARIRGMEVRYAETGLLHRLLAAPHLSELAAPHLTGLERLVLYRGNVPAAGVLPGSPLGRRIRELRLSGDGPLALGLGAWARNQWPTLEEWRINCPFDAEAVADLAKGLEAPRLGALLVSDDELPPDALARLLAAPALGGVRSLALVWRGSDPPDDWARFPAGARKLRVTGPPEGLDVVEVLTATLARGRFDHLELIGCGIGREETRRLAGWPGLADLTSLDLRANDLQRTGAEALAGSPHLGGLRELVLTGSRHATPVSEVLRGKFGRRVRMA
jgi:uncharacterized protein (TIGR02996 family)